MPIQNIARRYIRAHREKISVMVLLISISLFPSCSNQQRSMNENERNAKVDSIVGTRTPEIMRQAEVDLDHRRVIEVKAKADSLVAAYKDSLMGNKAPADNTIPNDLPMP